VDCYLLVNFGCLVKGCAILINPLFYRTKFGEELKFKVRYGFPLGYTFSKKKEKESVSLVGIVRYCHIRLFLSSIWDLFC